MVDLFVNYSGLKQLLVTVGELMIDSGALMAAALVSELCDVTSPLVISTGATLTFHPQKTQPHTL